MRWLGCWLFFCAGCSVSVQITHGDASMHADEPSDAGSRDAGMLPRVPSRNVAGSRAPDTMPDASPDLPAQSGVRIELPSGVLAGTQVGSTRMFLGIPYAKPPVGPLRFMPPEPVDPWTGSRDARKFGAACPQPMNGLAAQAPFDEDCLTLDVYSPSSVNARLPVMVFLHGGAFVNGASSQYDPRQLSQTPVVVVTVNYRLGALGFLSHPALDAARPDAPSGSDGIRDQQLALRWVRDNIGAFGGDREQVTLFGESAGAISACIHWFAPSSRGLAQRFILQSGTCTSDGPGVYTKLVANTLGMQLTDALCAGQSDVPACLRGKSADELANWGVGMGLFGAEWYPTIEGAGGVLPDYPERTINAAASLPPLIVGTNKNEWSFFQGFGGPKPATVAELTSTISQLFGAKAADVQAQYSAANDAEANDVYVRLISDMSFRCPTRTLAKLAAAKGGRAWMYSFEQGAAYHGLELDYVFGGSSVSTLFGGGAPAAALAAAVQHYWTRFAATGDPNGGSEPAWPQLTAADEAYLTLVDPPVAGHGLASGACDFWRDYWRNGGTVMFH